MRVRAGLFFFGLVALSTVASALACGAARDTGPAIGTSLPPVASATTPGTTSSAEPASTTMDGDAGESDPKPVVNEPDFDSIPWETGAAVGNGIASKDTQ
ncbi:MAG: hypothetical protein ABI175_04095, partial [Polyangiales bacterium]